MLVFQPRILNSPSHRPSYPASAAPVAVADRLFPAPPAPPASLPACLSEKCTQTEAGGWVAACDIDAGRSKPASYRETPGRERGGDVRASRLRRNIVSSCYSPGHRGSLPSRKTRMNESASNGTARLTQTIELPGRRAPRSAKNGDFGSRGMQ